MFTYLIATAPLLLVWFWIYKHEHFKEIKKEMLVMSLFVGFGSVATSYLFWTKDWWRPQTITNSIVGLEDFILGFAMGGVMTGVYHLIFHNLHNKKILNISKISFVLPAFILTVGTYTFIKLGLTSFWAITVNLFIFVVYVLFLRRDLWRKSLWSGLLTLLTSLFFYFTIFVIDNTWAGRTYMFNTLSQIKIFTFPIEEFVFWFLAGCFFGIYYEFILKLKIKKPKTPEY